MSLASDIHEELNGDATLAASLTGGVYVDTTIDRQLTPEAFDANSELKPCALVKAETEQAVGPYARSSRQFIAVYFYELGSPDNIETARQRVYSLLHRQQIGTGVWEIAWVDDVLGAEDPGIGACLIVSRYQVTRMRS